MLLEKDPEFEDTEESAPPSHIDVRQANNRMKNWKSESNLLGAKQAKLDGFNKSLNDKNDEENEEDYDEYDNFDYYIDGINGDETSLEDEVNNEPLQFSDHAGLYDPYEENLNSGDLIESKYLNEHNRRLLLDNMYTKKNYKLTYNKPNVAGFHDGQMHHHNPHAKNGQMFDSNGQYVRGNQNTDSLASSAMMQQSCNLDGSNYIDEDEDLEDDDQACETDDYVSFFTCLRLLGELLCPLLKGVLAYNNGILSYNKFFFRFVPNKNINSNFDMLSGYITVDYLSFCNFDSS